MKRFFILLLPVAGLLAVSCGSGYQVASSRYDDATYFRPDVTTRVHLLATAEEAEDLISQTIAQAGKEGAKVETVYTNPDGVVNIDVEPGTTYIIANQNNDTYARKLKMFDDEDQDFCLTINMDFGYDYMWSDPYYWYSPWHRPRYWYRPYSYWAQWYWYPRSWYYDFWYNDWWYNSLYYPSWSYSSWMGPYSYWSPYGFYGYPYGYNYSGYHDAYRHDNDSPYRENRRDNLRRLDPETRVASTGTRSGGSYRRVNPQINQISGDRTTRTPVRDDVKNQVTGRETTNYRRVTGTTNSEAVYRDPSTNTRSRSEQTTGNTFYRRSSNLSKNNGRENNRSSTTSSTINPGNSRSFYRGDQSGSTRINNNSGSSRVTRSYGNSSSSSYSGSGSRSTGSSVSSGSMRSSGGSSGGGGSVSRSGSSGGSYRR